LEWKKSKGKMVMCGRVRKKTREGSLITDFTARQSKTTETVKGKEKFTNLKNFQLENDKGREKGRGKKK